MKYLFRKTENKGIEINDACFVTVMESMDYKMVTAKKRGVHFPIMQAPLDACLPAFSPRSKTISRC